MLAAVNSRSRVPNKVTLYRRDACLDPRRCLNSGQPMQGFSNTIQRRASRDKAIPCEITKVRDLPLSREWAPYAKFGDPSSIWSSRSPWGRQRYQRPERPPSAPPSGARKPKPLPARVTGYGKGPANIRLEGTETGVHNLRATGGQPWNATLSSQFMASMRVDTPPTIPPQKDAKATLTAEGDRVARITIHTPTKDTGLSNTMASATTQGRSPESGKGYAIYKHSDGQMTTRVLKGEGQIQADGRRLPAELARHHSI